MVRETGEEVARRRRIPDAARARWIELNYEDDIETRDLSRLYDFLGLACAGPPEFRTERLSRPGYPHIANAAEIDRTLGSDAIGRLFD